MSGGFFNLILCLKIITANNILMKRKNKGKSYLPDLIEDINPFTKPQGMNKCTYRIYIGGVISGFLTTVTHNREFCMKYLFEKVENLYDSHKVRFSITVTENKMEKCIYTGGMKKFEKMFICPQ